MHLLRAAMHAAVAWPGGDDFSERRDIGASVNAVRARAARLSEARCAGGSGLHMPL